MTGRRDRLARLLGIRSAALRVVGGDLKRAIHTTKAVTALAKRIGELQVELTPTVVRTTGQQLKAALATRHQLQSAATRQSSRVEAATEQQASAARAFHRDSASAAAVERAIERRDAGRIEAALRSMTDNQRVRKAAR